MRSTFILLLALAAVSAAFAYKCDPHVCTRIMCAQVKEAECQAKGPEFHMMEAAGFCGCCPACVKFLSKSMNGN